MVGERKRAALVGALRCVDRVFLYDEVTADRSDPLPASSGLRHGAREHLRVPPRSAAEVDHLRAHLPQQLGLLLASLVVPDHVHQVRHELDQVSLGALVPAGQIPQLAAVPLGRGR